MNTFCLQSHHHTQQEKLHLVFQLFHKFRVSTIFRYDRGISRPQLWKFTKGISLWAVVDLDFLLEVVPTITRISIKKATTKYFTVVSFSILDFSSFSGSLISLSRFPLLLSCLPWCSTSFIHYFCYRIPSLGEFPDDFADINIVRQLFVFQQF